MNHNDDNRPFKEKYRIYIYPVVLAWIMTMFIRPIVSDGNAMLPNIKDGQVIIVSKETYSANRGAPKLQQVVAFRDDFAKANQEGNNTIRRVVGLPGDTIEIKNGKVYRNGKVLKEDYVKGSTDGIVKPIKLGEEEIYVLGDNRQSSIDSRAVGPLKMNLLRGHCSFAIWPLGSFGFVK